MSRDLIHLAARVFNTPLLIHPRKAEVLASVLADRLHIAPLVDLSAAKAEAAATREGRSDMLDRFDGERRGPKVEGEWGSYTQTRYLYRDGLALITVEGSLVNRGAYIGADSGVTSYEGVIAQLGSAAADRDVDRIILDFESPGGEAIGAFEMAAFVRAVSAEKKVHAIVNGMAASAAYAMASGAERIITTPSGVSGSIGVVMLHIDQSRRLDKAGVSPTLIYAGAHKVDGNPFAALPDDVRADFQAEVDQLYSMFVATVAAGRRGMTAESIRATEARTYIGADAVAAGLADDIGTLPDIVDDLSRSGRYGRSTRSSSMANTDSPVFTQAAYDAAIANASATAHAENAAALEAARRESEAVGATAERARISAILGLDEAKGRETMAHHLAFATAMNLEDARGMLAAAPVAAAAPPPLNRMSLVPKPAVRPDAPSGASAEARSAADIDASWDDVVTKMNAQKGFKAR